MSLAIDTDPDFSPRKKRASERRLKTAIKMPVRSASEEELMTLVEGVTSRRKISLAEILKNASSIIKFNSSVNVVDLRKVLEAYEGKEVYLRTARFKKTYLHGIIESETDDSCCYGIRLIENPNFLDHQNYKEFREMIVPFHSPKRDY